MTQDTERQRTPPADDAATRRPTATGPADTATGAGQGGSANDVRRRTYHKPRIVYRGRLEAMAAVCQPPTGKEGAAFGCSAPSS